MRRPEQALHRTIIAGLRACLPHGWVCHHSPNGMASSALQGAIFKGMGTLPGFPDIVVFGHADLFRTERPAAWFLEIKAPKGSLSPVQRDLHDRFRDLGFPVGIVRSWDDVQRLAREWAWPWREAA